VAELKAAFMESVDDYIETCRKVGKEPNKPYSGKLMFRVKPELHASAARAAVLEGKSLNQWAEDVLTEAVKRRTA
jgi:predicted HicB family RNase H-like nuclease